MATDLEFQKAADEVKTLKSRPSNDILLKLYALYKQGSSGDVQGTRPGMLDLKGRAKYDAWGALKGTTQDVAKTRYVQLVADLLKKG